ncbi:MAG: serine hydrolase domain-containing protein [Bacteroidota bacterium]
MRILFCLFACTLICCQSPKSAEAPSLTPKILAIMTQNAEPVLADSLISALSVGVFYEGEKYSLHLGSLDEGKNNPPTDNTLYEIASVSKTMVGLLLAQAEAEGKLSIEDDIRTHMQGDFPNLNYEGQPIKIKHLMTHTSRLPRFLPVSINALFDNIDETLPFRIAEIENAYSREQFFTDLKGVEIDTLAGTIYEYSNADTEIAAHILEQIYQTPFDELLQTYLAKTAEMSNTAVILDKQQSQNLAKGYGINRIPVPNMTIKLWGGAGGIKSNMPDLLQYMELQCNEQNPVVAKTHQPLYEGHLGYFWVLDEDSTYGHFVRHHGGAFGAQNWMFVFPEAGLGISVITNQSDLETADKLHDIVQGILTDLKALPAQ